MEADFWHAKWQKQETGFHMSQPHPLLCKYFQKAFADVKNIFVPLCGKTSDLQYLTEKGANVIGNELSPIAIQSYFEERQLTASVAKSGEFDVYSNEKLSIYVGDFFKLTTESVELCRGIYDRAALIALPKDMRQNYVEKMRSLFPSAKLLLITLDYEQIEMEGPPFSVVESEVNQLFDFAKINQIYRQDILDKEPKFRSRGLTTFNESAYFIEW